MKTALVTGAANGIGKACALRLAQDGMAVGVLDLDLAGAQAVAAQIESAGGKAIGVEADISDRAQVTAALDQVRAALGPITVLVNNAGISHFKGFDDLTDEDWDRVFAINCRGTFIVTQLCVPDMRAAQWGRIINISSSSAQTGTRSQVHYSASKGAVVSFTRSLADALGGEGITVNNIPPGAVMGTVMADENISKFPIPMEELVKKIPVGRTGVPEDIAHACSWLASEGSSYFTGQTMGMNGGRIPT